MSKNKEVNLRKEEKESRMDQLKEKVLASPYKEIRTDDSYLYRFLFVEEWDVNAAFERMEKIYKMQKDHSEFFLQPHEDLRRLLKQNVKFMLDKRDKNGRRIYVTKMGNINPSVMSVTDMTKLDDFWIAGSLEEMETIENGVSVIVDVKGYSWKMLKYVTPLNVKIIGGYSDLLPVKDVDFHVVNSSRLVGTAVSMIFPFLGQKTKDHAHFHYHDMKSLHKHLGAEALPVEYGGPEKLDLQGVYENAISRHAQKDQIVKSFVQQLRDIHLR